MKRRIKLYIYKGDVFSNEFSDFSSIKKKKKEEEIIFLGNFVETKAFSFDPPATPAYLRYRPL